MSVEIIMGLCELQKFIIARLMLRTGQDQWSQQWIRRRRAHCLLNAVVR